MMDMPKDRLPKGGDTSIDEGWVDKQLSILMYGPVALDLQEWDLFEPTDRFYRLLEDGDEGCLGQATEEVCDHLALSPAPSVTYELGLRMAPESAGEHRGNGGERGHIRMPLACVGKPPLIGAVLAHEVCHEMLARRPGLVPNSEELEPFTDLVSFAAGLGKLVLNGTVTPLAPFVNEAEVVGYLSPELKAYAFLSMNKLRGVSAQAARTDLTERALRILDSYKESQEQS